MKKLILSLFLILFCGCTYGPVDSRLSIQNMDVKPNTRTFVVAVSYVKQRLPTGINAFPDGGIPLVLDQQALFYLCDADKKSVKLLAKLEASKHLWNGFTPWVEGWEGERFYFQITGCAHRPCTGNKKTGYKNEYYAMNIRGEFHKVEQIPSNVKLNSKSLAAMSNEQNYIRLSRDMSGTTSYITVLMEDGGKFKRMFVIDNNKLSLAPAE